MIAFSRSRFLHERVTTTASWDLQGVSPPKGRRPWLMAKDIPCKGLNYLGWGKRSYGRHPVDRQRQFGFAYSFIASGQPQFLAGETTFRCRPGDLMISHVDCPIGWKDRLDRRCDILIWIFREPPSIECLEPEEGATIRLRLGPGVEPALRRNHAACRQEIVRSDRATEAAQRQLRLELDVVLARALDARGKGGQEIRLCQRAIRLMGERLGSPQPIAEICDILGVSRGVLQRQFAREEGATPLAVFNRMKREACRRLFSEGMSVKQVSIQMGYTYPQNLSRFLRSNH